MSKVTVTVKPATDAQIARVITRHSQSLGKSFADRKGVHVTRIADVLALRNAGLSYAGMEKNVTVALGYRPAGATGSTFGRYGQIIDTIARPDVDAIIGTSGAREAIVNALYRLSGPTPKSGQFAGTSPAARLASAADQIGKASGSAHAVEILDAMVAGFNAGEVTDATAPAKRQPAIGAQGADTEPTEPTAQSGSDDTGIRVTNVLAGATVLSLIAELTRRVGNTRQTFDDVIVEAFDALAAAVEERTSTMAALDAIDA